MNVKIKEVFESIQGEGPYIGAKQLFIRFCNCNLKCSYCDTDFGSEINEGEFCPQTLAARIREFDLDLVHSISLTGGEPLLQSEFLKEFLPLTGKKIYLETNATLADKLLEVKPLIDIIAADIKLPSATDEPNPIAFHEKFFENCRGVETFAKIVFNEGITDCEIEACADLGRKFGILLVLQPMMPMNVTSDFAVDVHNRLLEKYPNVRLIAQMHKFLDLR